MPSSPSPTRALLLLLLGALLLLIAAASAGTSEAHSNGRLHPPGWYLEQFRAWAQRHNVSLPFHEERFHQRLAVWAENKCVLHAGSRWR